MLPTDAAAGLVIRLLKEEEVVEIDRIFREAFGKQLGYPEPENFAPGRSCLARMVSQPEGAFGAYQDDELVAVSFASMWGRVGIFGPLAVSPRFWSLGVGRQLLQRSIEFFKRKGASDMLLCTFPDSSKHISFYKKNAFHPRSLIAMMSRLVPECESSNSLVSDSGDIDEEGLALFSTLNEIDRAKTLEECRVIACEIYEGLDLSREIGVIETLSIGDTVFLREGGELLAFAVCHFGQGSETETDVFYIKFAAALPHVHARENFRALLAQCLKLATLKKTNMMFFGVNTARQEAFESLLADGFKIDSLSVAMQSPNRDCYNHSGIYVIDDLR